MAEGGGDPNPWWNNKEDFGADDEMDDGRKKIGDQSRVLMTQFIHDRMEVEGLGDRVRTEEMYTPGTPRGAPVVGSDHDQISSALRRIGDELDGDARLQDMINRIAPDSPRETFMRVARDIFADGQFNWGRVAMLFYFAYKMAVKAISDVPLIRQIIEWVVSFIKKFVATWIIERGGWSAIQEYFGSSTTQAIGVFLAGILSAVFAYSKFK